MSGYHAERGQSGDPVRAAAECVVAELDAWRDPDRDSEYNMGPYPDPVSALVRFAQAIKEHSRDAT